MALAWVGHFAGEGPRIGDASLTGMSDARLVDAKFEYGSIFVHLAEVVLSVKGNCCETNSSAF